MKRKSGKRSWKLLYLEISFSWFKVVFLMKRSFVKRLKRVKRKVS